MQVSVDQDTMRVTIVLEPVFRPGVLSTLLRKEVSDEITELVIDTRYIEIMHSPMLGEFVQLYCHLQKRGVSVHLINVPQSNRKLFKYTRLNELLDVHAGEIETPEAG